MKYFLKHLLAGLSIICLFNACSKLGDMPKNFYQNGNAPILTSSVSSTKPAPADSLTNIIAFSWTNPKYANDSVTTKFILEFDSSGRSFSQKQTLTVTGKLTDSLTAKSLNNVLIALGFAYNTTYNVDVRLVSS